MQFSIIIPIFNEEKNLSILINEILNVFDDQSNYEIVIINDCSTDNSLKVLNKFNKLEKLKLINNESNIGQSYSIIKGVEKSTHNTIVTLDGDLQNNPRDIPILLKTFYDNKNVDLVSGIRAKRKDGFIKVLSSKIANNIRRTILKDNCTDTGCSLKIFDKNIFLKFPKFNGIHRFLPALFIGYGSKTLFLDVDHRPRISGISKYGTIDRMFRGIRDLIKVYLIIRKIKKKIKY